MYLFKKFSSNLNYFYLLVGWDAQSIKTLVYVLVVHILEFLGPYNFVYLCVDLFLWKWGS